ncbi:MAG: hypothetical protein FWH18_05855 [Marinilabiliaceae bacterium]|nr:hypothetical protein [Marinilabiliaceae bacterium]
MKPKFNTILKLTGFPIEEAQKIFNEALETDKTIWQNEKKWEIFKYHFNNNNYYNNFVGKEVSDWNDIPVFRPKDLKGNYFSKIPAKITTQKMYTGSTSGSSGSALVFVRDALSHALVWENVRHCYNQAEISLDDRQARMFGMSKKPLDIAKNRIKDWLSNRYRFDIFNLSDTALDEWVRHFKRGKFKYLYGYTNSLVVFAQYFINRKYTLKSIAPSVKCCIITAEFCTDRDAKILLDGFGIPLFNEYGTSELGIMGFKTHQNQYDAEYTKEEFWNCADELLYYEVLDDNDKPVTDGEMGLLTCTSLFNKATPFIRYQAGDLAIIKRENPRTIITQLMGRTNDLALLPSGRKIPGLSFYFVELNVIDVLQNVKEFIFRQTNDGFSFEYVSEKDITEGDFLKIKKNIELHLKEEITLTAVKVDKIERGKSGKFKHFISEI